MANQLFNVLSGIMESDYAAETLADTNAIARYAESCELQLSPGLCESIQEVGQHWISEQENGNGEWSRMAEEAKQALETYMHVHSGDVATREMWRSDFESMDVETWFGLEVDQCKDLHWLDDRSSMIEVEQVDGEWQEK